MLRLQKDEKIDLSLPKAKECSLNRPYLFPELTYTIFNNNIKRKSGFPNNLSPLKKRPNLENMPNDNHHRSNGDLRRDESPVAPLCNVGNTCYLNSVLYTLRFTPSFLHNLHHLICDLSAVNSKVNQVKARSSSLGRNVTGLSGSSSRSPSTKDLLSMGGNVPQDLTQKSPMQIVTEKLHDVFVNLHNQEEKNVNSPYEPKQLLQAVREVNEIFEGNQQQDAHELLLYLLDNVRSTCELLVNQLQEQSAPPELPIDEGPPNNASANNSKGWGVRKSWKKNKDKESGKKIRKEVLQESINEEITKGSAGGCITDSEEKSVVIEGPQLMENIKKKSVYNFVVQDFEGIALRRTRCLECEEVTETKELFYDLCVPVPIKNEVDLLVAPNDIYRLSCVSSEMLRDANKYWCENCCRYNEARREVRYERLPNLMVMQLKRFSTNSGSTEKVNSFLPTPLRLACFCDQCYRLAEDVRPHSYQLCSVIMHIGSTMAHGHYIAYTRPFDQLSDYKDCAKGCSTSGHGGAGGGSTNSERGLNIFNKFQFLKARNSESVKNGGVGAGHMNGAVGGTQSTCKSKDCCGIKLNKPVVENAANYSLRSRDCAGGPMWLECDDENVKAISSKDLEELLSYKTNSTSTPYLLFYAKCTDTLTGREAVGENDYAVPLI